MVKYGCFSSAMILFYSLKGCHLGIFLDISRRETGLLDPKAWARSILFDPQSRLSWAHWCLRLRAENHFFYFKSRSERWNQEIEQLSFCWWGLPVCLTFKLAFFSLKGVWVSKKCKCFSSNLFFINRPATIYFFIYPDEKFSLTLWVGQFYSQ